MYSTSNVATGRRAVPALVRRAWNWGSALLLVALAMAWSSAAQAQSCDFVAIGPTSQLAPAGSTISFTLEAQTACSPTVNISLAVTPPDNTGGATIVPPANPTITLDTPYTFAVTLGPNPGAGGSVTATCLSGGCAGDTLVFNFTTNNQFVYAADGPASVVTNQLQDFAVATSIELNGGPAGLNSNFTNLTTATPYGVRVADTNGIATLTETLTAAGSYVVRASLVCPVAFVLEGCAAVPPVDFNVLVEPVSLNPVTPLTVAGNAGVPQTLTVSYGSASFPGPDGTPITWTVLTQPVGGDGAVTGTALLGGQSNGTFNATVPGDYAVQASVACTPCAISSRIFTVTVIPAPLPVTLVEASANPASGTVGVPQVFSVELEQGGLPLPAEAIAWSATAPFSPTAANTLTNGAGVASASFTPSAAGTFPAAVTASFDPDGIPASGDELTVSFDVVVASVPGLVAASGDGQQALPGSAFALPVTVTADDSGLPAVGVGITWSLVGDATLVPGGPTDASGQASASVTAGTTPGPLLVTATRQDAPAVSVSFTLFVDQPGNLQIVSGDGQTLPAGVLSEPMVIRLLDAGGAPVSGIAITWSTTAGTLESPTSVTDGSGEASMRLTLDTPGEAEVTANAVQATAPVVFRLRGALAGLSGLNATQAEVAGAVDNFCPALAGLPSRTPGQQDLYERCQELARAAGIDPAATVLALDQLMADVALAQANSAFAAAQSQFQNLRARIAALRSGTQGTDFGGLALSTPQGLFSLGLMAQSLGDEDPSLEIGADFSRWGFFVSGVLGRGEVDPGQVDPAYDTDIEGLTAGVDYRISDRWILGGSLGMTRQDTTLPGGRGEIETSGWSVSGYTTYYRPDSWYMDGVVTWGRNDYDLLREINYTLPQPGGTSLTIDQRARSASDGDLLSLAFTFGRDFNKGAWGLGPYGRLLFTRVDFEAIEETLQPGPGSGLGLRIEERELESLASVLGGKLTYTHSTDWGVLMPHLQLEWEHEFRDDPQALEARFLNDPTGTAMLLRGDELDTDYFRIGLGLSMVLTKGRSGFFYYERLMGKDRTSQYNLALGFRMEF